MKSIKCAKRRAHLKFGHAGRRLCGGGGRWAVPLFILGCVRCFASSKRPDAKEGSEDAGLHPHTHSPSLEEQLGGGGGGGSGGDFKVRVRSARGAVKYSRWSVFLRGGRDACVRRRRRQDARAWPSAAAAVHPAHTPPTCAGRGREFYIRLSNIPLWRASAPGMQMKLARARTPPPSPPPPLTSRARRGRRCAFRQGSRPAPA